ncbi:hypothetical protein K435DRAFT_854017 [Dendrothele bispora CBS 962.96]|uniref:Uncharacterized protein n=1 Tax=Dendrothele bispora (strain CBS 962.96) TaxID=1314807 RepID=A0A4S8MFG8_DENBC|nr:hypothetical protein K435DRAFT_854017 [Dendrothele bispora CBS 962.96]
MSEIDIAQFLGCSPTLNTAVGSTGKAGQNYKYYLIPGGPKPGSVWIKYSPEGARRITPQPHLDILFDSLHTHDHVPVEKHPFSFIDAV